MLYGEQKHCRLFSPLCLTPSLWSQWGNILAPISHKGLKEQKRLGPNYTTVLSSQALVPKRLQVSLLSFFISRMTSAPRPLPSPERWLSDWIREYK